jgi:hypothetical protein
VLLSVSGCSLKCRVFHVLPQQEEKNQNMHRRDAEDAKTGLR